ncbi:negative elongation factor E [Dermacentor andersoni]|uniref:negative elongation factor E n=1 Tax=Dermacentor andersoni TaxID=34620 RepID=UPI0021553C00|nr:negative elongation factor E-like [Dermacentor andersoni]
MVYLHFPSQYTEEEDMLQKKYQKLKRKKKALQQTKTPKQEPPPVQTTLRKGHDQVSESKPDAKEVAKKLLKSGAISAIKVENKERHGFKRSKASERKRSLNDRPGGIGYQPYAANHPTEDESDVTGTSSSSPSSSRPAMKSLYESFVSGGNLDEDDPKHLETPRDSTPEKPRQKNTLYVHGAGVSEDLLRGSFAPYGSLLNISMELDKNCGFVTFEKIECAEKAVVEMNGATVSGIKLRVSFARRQPLIPQSADGSPATWTSMASNYSQKGGSADNRKAVLYNDLDLF